MVAAHGIQTSMNTRLETGNATEVARDTRGWFVGDLIAWARKRGDSPADPATPRQTSQVEVKWSDHPPGDRRRAPALPDAFMTLAILVDGEMITEFISASGERSCVTQSRRGDYVLWHGPSYSHQWRTDSGATIVTVRWPATD
jgi:hypothetical protein